MQEENSITTEVERKDAFRLDAELRTHAGTIAAAVIAIGRCLKEINDRKLYRYLDSSTFAEYAEAAVGLKERAAYNYIAVYEQIGEEGIKKYGEIGITKLVLLTQLDAPEREKLLESGQAAELSTRELKEQIKELRGDNDQLKFDLEDAELTAKNNATQISELQKQLIAEREEKEKRDKEIKLLKDHLTEAERPVVADMSAEEKEQVRKDAEKKAKDEAKKEIKKIEDIHKKELDRLKTEAEAREKSDKEKSAKIRELTDQLEAATLANAELQANAGRKEKPVLAGSEEALKFCLEDIQQQFTRAVVIIGKMDAEKKAKFKAGIVGIVGKLREAAEGIA